MGTQLRTCPLLANICTCYAFSLTCDPRIVDLIGAEVGPLVSRQHKMIKKKNFIHPHSDHVFFTNSGTLSTRIIIFSIMRFELRLFQVEEAPFMIIGSIVAIPLINNVNIRPILPKKIRPPTALTQIGPCIGP